MSSETSIETRGAADGLHPWQLFTLAGLIGATIVVFVSRGQTPSGIVLLSLIIFTAAVVGVATWRTLAPLTGQDDPMSPQILGGRTRAAIEREKALVLRTIKELEFDRAMGKVSDRDFAEMSTRLRSRAAGLIRQLDAGSGYRETIEREIEKRLRGPQGSAPHQAGSTTSAPHQAESARSVTPPITDAGRAFTARHECQACNASNDSDARFCKSCGAWIEASQ